MLAMKPAQPVILALLTLALLPACATPTGPSRPGRHLGLSRHNGPGLEVESESSADRGAPIGDTSRGELDDEAWEEARRAEADRALEALWSLAGATNMLGAQWEFRFWSEGGALTVLSLHHTETGDGALAPISRGAFLPRLSRELPHLLGNSPREVTLMLERQETGWSADLDTSSRKEPPSHARTVPSSHGGSSGTTHQQVVNTARGISRLMSVPRGGSAELVAQVSLEDGRVLSWEPAKLDSSGDGPVLAASDDAVNLVVAVLLPFTRGLGERTVALELQAEHRQGEARPRWRILAAHVVEPPPLPIELADLHQEYRRLHESILIEFQEQTREYAILAAGFTLEQIAYSIVGGLALKGAWVLIGKGAPTIVSILSKGGKVAVRWFRDLLVRAPAAEREALLRLWTKAESQGLNALTAAEKQQFQVLMGRLEKVLESPVGLDAKGDLRRWSRKAYFEQYHPELAKLLGNEGMSVYEVHHLCPLQYTHLFPKRDITGKANLVGLHKGVHDSVSRIWGSLKAISGRMKAQDVQRVMEAVNRHYRRWFDKVYDPKDAAALARAEQSVLSELAQLKAQLSR